MIEQLNYSTTSRYNFPQTIEEMELPKRLTELSLGSMHNAKGSHFQPCDLESPEPLLEKTDCTEPLSLNGRAFSTFLTPLEPIQDGTPIIGIDVSSIRIGETEKGVICAVRGVVVWNEKRRYRYLRLGPFPFHITDDNKTEIFSHLGQQPSLGPNLGTFAMTEAQSQLCSLVERWIQMTIACSTSRSIILWDGSLTAGTPGNSASTVSQILKVTRSNFSSVLAFSKATTLRFFGLKITDLVLRQKPPCLFEADDLPLSPSKTLHLLGRICVANLSEGGCSFRLDIDRNLPRDHGIRAVERLLGNELVFQGYPETLRLAHIYSTFTANDVIGIQGFLKQEYGLKVIARPNIRKTLFGPYGTGFED